MGYTHYWKIEKFTEQDKNGYLNSLDIINKIVNDYRDVLCKDYGDENSPPIVTEKNIHLNGKFEDGHETFLFTPYKSEFNFCKTARKPYDTPVCFILIILSSFMPNLVVSTDGDNKEWEYVFENLSKYIKNIRAEIVNGKLKLTKI